MWDPDGKGRLSEVGRKFLAGCFMRHAGLTWMWAPYVNSYRRYVPGSWAPTAVVWADDNRTCGFRLVGSQASRRVECRIPGSDVNPYLALAAFIAGGLCGIEQRPRARTRARGNAYVARGVPGSLRPSWKRYPSWSEARSPPTHSATKCTTTF